MGNVSCIGNNCVIDAVDSLSSIASTTFDAFSGGVVPLLFGASVVAFGIWLVRFVVGKVNPGHGDPRDLW